MGGKKRKTRKKKTKDEEMSDYTLATTEGKHCNYLTDHHEFSEITQLNHTGDCNFSWTVNNNNNNKKNLFYNPVTRAEENNPIRLLLYLY